MQELHWTESDCGGPILVSPGKGTVVVWLVKEEGQLRITLKYRADDREEPRAILGARTFDPISEEWKQAAEEFIRFLP